MEGAILVCAVLCFIFGFWGWGILFILGMILYGFMAAN